MAKGVQEQASQGSWWDLEAEGSVCFQALKANQYVNDVVLEAKGTRKWAGLGLYGFLPGSLLGSVRLEMPLGDM